MKLLSIDIETTGLEPESCEVLEFAAILWDVNTPPVGLPTFHTYIKHDILTGDPYAFSMHPVILRRIANEEPGFRYTEEDMLGERLFEWLSEVHPECIKGEVAMPILAGKNVAGFDMQFLKKMYRFNDRVKPKHRTFDPAILFFDPESDLDLPSINECCTRAGLNTLTKHDAMGDAMIVIQLLNNRFHS